MSQWMIENILQCPRSQIENKKRSRVERYFRQGSLLVGTGAKFVWFFWQDTDVQFPVKSPSPKKTVVFQIKSCWDAVVVLNPV